MFDVVHMLTGRLQSALWWTNYATPTLIILLKGLFHSPFIFLKLHLSAAIYV